MANAITIQALQDASLDAKSLEEVVNGDENVVVTTRLGETYPSVKSVLVNVISKLGAVAGGNLGIYSSEALGIEGTGDGDMFWVFPNIDNDLDSLVLYQNSSGTAVELYELLNLNQFMIMEGEMWA